MNMTPAALKALLEGNLANFVAASTPGGIEAQEKAGQIEQSFPETLPREGTEPGSEGRKQFESLGFKFKDKSDDIFTNVEFPKGWRKRVTDHAMWTDLLDGKGRRRGRLFYKAAFYDRSAHVCLDRRFSISSYEPTEDPAKNSVAVMDAGKLLKEIGRVANGFDSYKEQMLLKKEAEAWLDATYPNWKDPMAYWD